MSVPKHPESSENADVLVEDIWHARLGIAYAAVLVVAALSSNVPMRWLARRLARYQPRVLYIVETTQKAVALTIDDGPDARTTPEILDSLQCSGAQATFFVISSNITGNEALLERIVAEGHELGNHLTRDEPATNLSDEEFEDELLLSHRMLTSYSDQVTWFRPGSGRFTEAMLDTLEKHDYRCALGSVYPFDARIPSCWFATWVILSAAKPGSVLILHDLGARGKRTVTTLNNILPRLTQRGFRVVTLSQLTSLSERNQSACRQTERCR